MNKYERFILDKRELIGIEKKIIYWDKFMLLPPEKLQSELYDPAIYSKWKSERKEARKDFVRKVEGHSQKKAAAQVIKWYLELGRKSESILAQLKCFSVIDKMRIKHMESSPRSTVNSQSWNWMQVGTLMVDGFAKGINEGLKAVTND